MSSNHRKTKRTFNVLGDTHELTFSCLNKRAFLATDPEKAIVLESVDLARIKLNFEVMAYVIMPNHVHLLVLPLDSEATIDRILHKIKRASAQQILRTWKNSNQSMLDQTLIRRHDGSTFHRIWMPGGGYDRNLTTSLAIQSSIQYIHSNPVTRRLVESEIDWQWSSARAYAGCKDVAFKVDFYKAI